MWCRVCEIRWTRAAVKFNQMSNKSFEMSGEVENNFAYPGGVIGNVEIVNSNV